MLPLTTVFVWQYPYTHDSSPVIKCSETQISVGGVQKVLCNKMEVFFSDNNLGGRISAPVHVHLHANCKCRIFTYSNSLQYPAPSDDLRHQISCSLNISCTPSSLAYNAAHSPMCGHL
ncbi:hypothetical protein NPIL_245781 [Nephila pilipes]|uniref:Uncharacterized protein n=1 Tax=Nephila pilipes TaxID=299642 RepID=A0A8X6JXY0_NEPPI|nr:hypothetical protein NPIL_245781 [Nephila pilipes]